ncbi:MAG: hypothetical protein QUS33_12760 [Dehalococcoidia bacterium]|nr:hypothetical protein [Dehalococcoidia bacterium]
MLESEENPMTMDGNPSQEVTANLTLPHSRVLRTSPCDEATVRLSIAALETEVLEAHKTGKASAREVRAAFQAGVNARQSIEAGVDLCLVLPKMMRELLRAEDDGNV